MADIREIKNKFFTSVEQGRQLVSSGIDPNSSDMHWSVYGHTGGKVIDGEYRLCFNSGCWDEDENGYADVPCWSLSSLLSLFPKNTRLDENILIKPWVTSTVDGQSFCQFGEQWKNGSDSVDAVFNMLMETLKK